MTLLVDIECPDCGRTTSVRKRGLGRYYCTECEREFTHEDVEVLPRPSRTPDPPSDAETDRD